jgi:hypothetical protein
MKLTKGKIARLHKTKRQSVKKQKWNKKHRNVKNLMSLNQKIPSHLANKSMKKYKKVGGELVQYGGELSEVAIQKLRVDVEKVTLKIMERSKINNAFLNKYSLNYAEFMCQIYNQPNYNINTLKKASNEVTKIVRVKQVNIAGAAAGVNGFITACSDGTISRFDRNWVQHANNITKHDAPITAMEIVRFDQVLVTGSSDGLLQIYDINLNTYMYVDFSGSSTASKLFFSEVTRPIISIIASQDNNHVIVTYCKSVSENDEKEMVLSSYNIINNQRVGESLFSDLLSKIKSIVLEQKRYNFYYSTNIRSVVSNIVKTRIAICRDHVVDIVEVDTRGVVLESGDNNKTLLSKFLDGFHVASFCTLNNNLIACGCKSILTIWNYALPLNTRVMETPIFKLTLLSDITSIFFTNNTIYCGLKNGAIQVNTYVYNAGNNSLTLTNSLANLGDIYWLVGHLDSVNSIFLDAVGPNPLYSCSDDGTVRQWNVPAPLVASVNSVIQNFSNPMLNLLTVSPFGNINLSVKPDNPATVNAVTNLVRANANLHVADYVAYQVEFVNIMNSLRAVDLTLISQSLITARRVRFQKEDAQILKQTNGINDQNADAVSFTASVNAINSISEQEKATKIAEYNAKTNKTIQSIVNKHNIEMDKIYDEFLKSIASIFNRFISDETRRLKTSMESVKTIVLNYVYKCIFNAVDTLNKYYIQEIEVENGTTMIAVSTLMAEFLTIKRETKEQIGDTIWSSQSSWWKSLDNIEKFYSDTEENDPEVILGLSQQSSIEIKRKSLLLEAEKQLPNVKDENLYFYQELMWAYGLIGELINKIKLYNLDTDQFDIYQDLYKSNDLYPEEVLDILCQTDVLSDRSYEEISKFAFTFQKGYGFPASHFDPMTIHNTPEALNFTYYIDENKVIKPDAINEFIRFAREEYIAVPTREMLITLFNKIRTKLFQDSPIMKEILQQTYKAGSGDPAETLQFNFSKVNISLTQEKSLQDFKKSIYELQKLYLQNNIFYMRSLSKTFQMIPSPRTGTETPSVAVTTNVVQTNAEIDSWEKLKNILYDKSNPRSDDTFQRWFKVLWDNRVSTEKELFDMSPGALDKLNADSVWNNLKNKTSGKLGFIASLNRARLNREIMKQNDTGKLIDEKFLKQILDDNTNARSFARYTELKDILNKNGITTEGSLSLLTDDVISKLDKKIQPLMRDYLKTVNPAASVDSKEGKDIYGLFPGNNRPGLSQPVQLDGSIIIGSDVGKQLNEDLQLQLHNGKYPRDNNGNIIVPPDADKTFVNNLKEHIQRNINTPQQQGQQQATTGQPPEGPSQPPEGPSQPPEGPIQTTTGQPAQTTTSQPPSGQPPGQQQTTTGQPPEGPSQPPEGPSPAQTTTSQPPSGQPPGQQPGPLVQQQSSLLTNEQIGKATEILINEIAYKIGPIINNMPYGEQQNTSVVAQAAQALAKGVYNHITNVQPPQPLNATTTSFMPNSQQLVTDASETNNNINNNDELMKELISNLSASVENNKAAAAEHNELLRQLIEKSNTNPNPELQTQINALKTEMEKDKIEAENMRQLLSKVPGQNLAPPPQTTGSIENISESAINNQLVVGSEQAVVIKPANNEKDLEFVTTLVGNIKPPWFVRYKSAENESISKGGQRGGGNNDIFTCYVSRLQRLVNKDTSTRITNFEIYNGIVEKWLLYKTGTRRVNVIPFQSNSNIYNIDQLHKAEILKYGGSDLDNILYVRFDSVPVAGSDSKGEKYEIKDLSEGNYKLLEIYCLEASSFTYTIFTSEQIEDYPKQILEYLKLNPKITTINFLVTEANNDYVQPEYKDKMFGNSAVLLSKLKQDNMNTLKLLKDQLLYFATDNPKF